jgi:hypothetical protein
VGDGVRCTAQLAIRKAKLLQTDTCREMEDILIGEGDDWPTDYYHGFDEPIAVITAILLDAESWDLSICWPEVLSGWKDAESLLTCLESMDCSSSVYKIFDEIDGCSLKDSLWDAGAPGLSGWWVSVFVKPAQLKRVLATVVKLSDALKNYWISSGYAAAAVARKG